MSSLEGKVTLITDLETFFSALCISHLVLFLLFLLVLSRQWFLSLVPHLLVSVLVPYYILIVFWLCIICTSWFYNCVGLSCSPHQVGLPCLFHWLGDHKRLVVVVSMKVYFVAWWWCVYVVPKRSCFCIYLFESFRFKEKFLCAWKCRGLVHLAKFAKLKCTRNFHALQ